MRRLRTLAACWHVSQAEVIRRTLEKAENDVKKEAADPYDLLTSYHTDGNLTEEAAESYIREIYEDRSEWRGP